jgi:spheroidene monooxygenase
MSVAAAQKNRPGDTPQAYDRSDVVRDNAATRPAADDLPVALVVLVDLQPAARAWGYAAFLLGRFAVARAPGLRFFKMLGSGHDGGFGLRPSATRQGMFCVFGNDGEIDAFLAHHPVMRGYRARAAEFFSVRLRATSVRGSWSGKVPLVARPDPGAETDVQPVAVLTRASIRPFRAAGFWRHAPPAEVSLGQAPGCLLAVGLGEAPVLRQATFSIWKSAATMNAYARRGAHHAAIRASAAGGYFSESMFVRFEPHDAQGRWHGRGVDLAPAVVAGART